MSAHTEDKLRKNPRAFTCISVSHRLFYRSQIQTQWLSREGLDTNMVISSLMDAALISDGADIFVVGAEAARNLNGIWIMNESLFYRDQILIVRICVVQMQNRTVTSDLLRTSWERWSLCFHKCVLSSLSFTWNWESLRFCWDRVFVLIHTTPLSSTQMVQPVVRWADLPCGPRGPGQQPLALPRGAPAHPRHPPSPLRQSSSAPIARRSPTSPAPTAAPPQAAGWSTAPPHHLLLHPSTEAAVATLHRPPIWKCPPPHPLTAGRSPSHRPPTEATPLPILWSRHHLPADRQREALQLLHLRLRTDHTHRAASPTGRPT